MISLITVTRDAHNLRLVQRKYTQMQFISFFYKYAQLNNLFCLNDILVLQFFCPNAV